MKLVLPHIFRVIFFSVLALLALEIYHKGAEIKRINEENAQLNSASYGIFNANEWKCLVSKVIENQIEKTDINKAAVEIADYIEKYFNESAATVRKQEFPEEENVLLGIIKQIAGNEIRRRVFDIVVPMIKKTMIEKVKENEDEIKQMLKQRASGTLENAIHAETESLNFTADCQPKEPPQLVPFEKQQNELNKFIKYFIGLVIFYLIFAFLYYNKIAKTPGRLLVEDSILIGLALLLLGISAPMLEINARLLDFRFQFMDEEIVFNNQVLYYQSKSIMELVQILIKHNPFVAVLIFSFSIVVPVIKLTASLFVLYSKRLASNKIFVWLVQNISKWSMADVFVVAIFLATLGYKSMINQQMGMLTGSEHITGVIDTQTSSVQLGFYFFLAYCLVSIATSGMVKKFAKK